MAGYPEVRDCVLDTSVIVKWFSGHREQDLEHALRLRGKILDGSCSVAVPDLLLYELSNAMRCNRNFSSGDVKDAVGSVFDMGFQIRQATRELMERAVDLAYACDVTVYDASFLAVAETEDRVMVTADYRFFDRVSKSAHVVRLSDLNDGSSP